MAQIEWIKITGGDEMKRIYKNFISVLAILALVIAMIPGLAGDAFATWGSYGLSVGTYNKTKVKVTAAGNANYEASGAKAVTFTVKVK